MTNGTLSILLGVALWIAPTHAGSTVQPQNVLRLVAAPTIVKGVQALAVSVINVGDKPIAVADRFVLNAEDATPEFRDVWYEVRSESGSRQQFGCAVKAGFIEKDKFRVLEPGGIMGHVLMLEECYRFSPGAVYSVVVHLKHTPKKGAGIPAGAFLEELVAPVVKVPAGSPSPKAPKREP